MIDSIRRESEVSWSSYLGFLGTVEEKFRDAGIDVSEALEVVVEHDEWKLRSLIEVRARKHAVERGVGASRLLEELIREELGDYVDEALGALAGSDSYELGFDPVEPKGPVSLFVRETWDERERGLLGR